MAIGVTEEHAALAASVRGLIERHASEGLERYASERLERYASERLERYASERLERYASERLERHASEGLGAALAAQGLPGLHLPESAGGQGFGLLEQAVVLEELGRAMGPGSYAPAVLASAILRDGSRAGAVGLSGSLRTDGSRVFGTVRPVVGAADAEVFVLPAGDRWAVVDRAECEVAELESLDVGRPAGAVTVDAEARFVDGVDVRALAVVVFGAEACGVAGRALDEAVAYAKLREQFGRPIGQFQGVKHKCARMLIALERARAAVWDAARALDEPEEQRAYAVSVAGVLAADAAVQCAEGNIQVHGGIGYTYEHDAHLFYRRALTLRAVLGRASGFRGEVAARALSGVRRPVDVDLPEEAADLRGPIREEVAAMAAMEPLEQRAAMAEGGWVTPHLPRPWGRDAGPVEQIVVRQELKAAGVRPVPLMIAAWVVPSLVQYGSEEQKERFLPPTLRGEIIWCQLFSEPGAGSDLAGLRTRAERVEGGWRITGQKIWTSLARESQWAICLARTDADRPKHDGITYFLVDMASAGIDVRPLRECTGDAVFNEVFLDGVFVPDELVVGPVNEGWRVARNTLANERVGLTTSFQLGGDVPKLLRLAGELDLADDPVVRDGLGDLVCDEHALGLLSLRATLKQISGTDPGATANVRKLVAMEHGQRVTEFGFGLLGEFGALTGGWKSEPRARWTRHLLASRAMTIGGGTTEVNLNVIGERILGLPRDPEPVG